MASGVLTKDFALTEMLRKMNERVESGEGGGSEPSDYSEATETNTPAAPLIINFLDNSEFFFSDAGYNKSTYAAGGSIADPDDVLAQWYRKQQSDATRWTEIGFNASDEGISGSAESIIYSAAAINTDWDKASGTVRLGGGYKIAHPLINKYLSKGNYIIVRMDVAKEVGASVLGTAMLKVSAWDNTAGQEKIIEGVVQTVNPSVTGGGAVHQRKYILEVDTPSGLFYSDIAPAAVNLDAATGVVSTTNFVTLEWTPIQDARRYRLFRWSDQHSSYYEIANIVNGGTSFIDRGTHNASVTIPAAALLSQINQKAQAFIENFGSLLIESMSETVVALRIPASYNFALTTDKQWIQIEIVTGTKNSHAASTTADVPERSIIIDRVALSYSNGVWTPSARDLIRNPVSVVTSPPENTGGGGSGGGEIYNPETGGGYGCIHREAYVLAWKPKEDSWYWKKAKLVQRGDEIVGVNNDGIFVRTKVQKVQRKWYKSAFSVSSNAGMDLFCSNTQPFIANQDLSRQEVVHVRDFEPNQKVVGADVDGIAGLFESEIMHVVELDEPMHTVHFLCSDFAPNYIASNEPSPRAFLLHNRKPSNTQYDYMYSTL